jgi:acyl carrier protein
LNREEILERLKALFESEFGIPASAVTPEATVRGGLELDSIEVMTLIELVEETFSLKRGASFEAYAAIETLDDLIQHIQRTR